MVTTDIADWLHSKICVGATAGNDARGRFDGASDADIIRASRAEQSS